MLSRTTPVPTGSSLLAGSFCMEKAIRRFASLLDRALFSPATATRISICIPPAFIFWHMRLFIYRARNAVRKLRKMIGFPGVYPGIYIFGTHTAIHSQDHDFREKARLLPPCSLHCHSYFCRISLAQIFLTCHTEANLKDFYPFL